MPMKGKAYNYSLTNVLKYTNQISPVMLIISQKYFIVKFNHILSYSLSYVQYLTEMSTPLTFFKIFYYIFSCDKTEEMTLCYKVK